MSGKITVIAIRVTNGTQSYLLTKPRVIWKSDVCKFRRRVERLTHSDIDLTLKERP